VPLVLSVHPSLPVHDTKQLVAFAKQRPGRITMASAGTGSTTHMTGELFQLLTGAKFTHVPYKGSGPALIDLVGGQVDLIFDQISTSQGLVKVGKLRALGVATQRRSAFLPEVPTMEEVDIKGISGIDVHRHPAAGRGAQGRGAESVRRAQCSARPAGDTRYLRAPRCGGHQEHAGGIRAAVERRSRAMGESARGDAYQPRVMSLRW
jgi:hypothetical protein